MRRTLLTGNLVWLLAGCAATTAPLPPPLEYLLVVNRDEPSLSFVPLRPDGVTTRLLIPVPAAVPLRVATRGTIALVPLGPADGVAVVDLVHRRLDRIVQMAPGARPFDALLISDSVAYVSNAGLNSVTRIDLRSDDTASVAVGQWPTAILPARGRLFVLNANLAPCPDSRAICGGGESWLTVVDPFTNTRSAGRDSVPLPGPGNASSGAVAGDGFLYILNTGSAVDGSFPEGRLSIVDPIRRIEIANLGGFGAQPNWVISDGGERLFIASPFDGLLEFNTRTRSVVRGAGQGIPVVANSSVVVDRFNLIYALEAGSCTGGSSLGRVRVFRANLTEIRAVTVGPCAVGMAIALVPADGQELPPELLP